jgi:hypothetical protein
MKNKRALIVMAVAIVFGLAAVVFASRWLLSQPGSGSGRIAVAAADISLGQRLTPEMFKLAEWPADSVPKGAFTDPQKLAGRVLKNNLLMGEPVSEIKLAPAGTLGGLSALITEGKRAITVRVNDVIGVAGFALPGNYVDIIVSTQKDVPPGSDAREQKHLEDRAGADPGAGGGAGSQPRRDQAEGGQRGHAGSHAGAGREARPGAQRRHAVAGAAQPGRSAVGRYRRRHQADAAAGKRAAAAPKPAPKPRRLRVRRRWWSRWRRRCGAIASPCSTACACRRSASEPVPGVMP